MNTDSNQSTGGVDDEQRIRRVLERYYFGIDTRDRDVVASCFTRDAQALYHKGFDTEVALSGNYGIADFLLERISVYSGTNHLASNTSVRIDGATAHAECHAIAHVVYAGDVRIRGLRYVDDLVRAADGAWRIARRTHIPLWQYHAAEVKPSIPKS